ncbi:hypothetical protein CERZMDRAFT_91423 [Cercospora zeae-maydis SCOH1-5]|uniref:Uncharacterized protein n=1 Tax=Cercospora zeae-maydis SCOH1-5 TaxID=717836 RepID=A0A6A6F8H9_9PEZI|nr:hypothetical protein CERZMDRAFT_91423 [Cercospora zeae-maydis SCOH1-5]
MRMHINIKMRSRYNKQIQSLSIHNFKSLQRTEKVTAKKNNAIPPSSRPISLPFPARQLIHQPKKSP